MSNKLGLKQERRKMVAAATAGKSLREVAAQTEFLRRLCNTGLSALKASVWIVLISVTSQAYQAQGGQPHSARKSSVRRFELRRELKEQSDLGEFGAAAIHREMEMAQPASVAVPYLHNQLSSCNGMARRGLPRASAQTCRRPVTSIGSGIPCSEVVAKLAELDQFDFVEGLVIKDGLQKLKSLNAVSLHGGLVGAWPTTGCTAESARMAMIEDWRQWGLPDPRAPVRQRHHASKDHTRSRIRSVPL